MYIIKKNDTYDTIIFNIDANYSLTGVTASFLMKDGTVKSQNSEEVILITGEAEVDVENRTVSYKLHPGDTTKLGNHLGEFHLTFPDGSVKAFPESKGFIPITINESIDGNRSVEINEEIAIYLSKIDEIKEEFYREKSALYEDNDTFKSTTSGLLDEKIEIFDREIEKATPYHVGDTPPVNKGAVWYKTV